MERRRVSDRARERSNLSILLVVDSPVAPFFDLQPHIDFVKLPTVVKVGAGVFRPGSLLTGYGLVKAMRSTVNREVLARFAHGEFKLIRAHLVPYYRDVYDALFHIGELAQAYTDSLTGNLQVYLNMSSNQTGEVVKLLTLITVITTPLMMVGTWYGMNFHDMPELGLPHAYPTAAAITFLSTAGTIWYFKRKKWF